ncbi:hypothetical protein [Robertmurraya massiliosenegalensis]|uniref:hypothetical protein n=1 Tax=Robertmurraya massiliosenegalensis TaxID=1287657 RepID=UPI0002D9F7F7|nr:hypothetical protein [Robertmurraya massiliosenegalensis]
MQFLLDNPFIIIILLGILSSLFKKNKEQPTNKRPTRQASPTSTESSPPSNPMAEIFKEFIEVEEEKPAKPLYNEYIDTKKEAEAKIAALREQQKQYAERANRMNTQSRMNIETKPIMVTETTNSGRTFNVEGEKLADAIIWSEILGPPRAKKPHRSMNYRSR